MDYRSVIRNPNLVPFTYNNLTVFHYRRGHLKDIHSMVLGSGITAKGIRQEKAFIHTLYNQRNFFFNFILFFKLYIIVLVLPNIKMNPPQVYMCSPS